MGQRLSTDLLQPLFGSDELGNFAESLEAIDRCGDQSHSRLFEYRHELFKRVLSFVRMKNLIAEP